MSELKQKISFNNIWKLLLKADSILGLFLFKDPPVKKTYLEWFYKLTLYRSIILLHILIFSTLITTKFSLISVIFCISIESVFIGLYIFLLKCLSKKQSVISLVTWCKELYDIKKKFHAALYNLAETHLESIERKTTKALKMCRFTMYFETFMITFGFFGLGIILPETIIPKYTLSVPLYLPFTKQDNWIAFLVTMFIQTIVLFDGTTIVIFVFSILFILVIHVLGYLDIIVEVAKCIAREIKMKINSKKDGEVTQSQLDTDLLKSIYNSLENKKEISFEEWIKIITDMISDVSFIISLFSGFYSTFFFTCEVSSFSGLFMCGLIFTVIHQQYVFAVAVLVGVFVLWLVCFINEKILDKFDDIKATLYDIPWYELEPKQNKLLLIAMNCDEIQKGFTAAGMHNLTIERFAIVVKAGYTNLLVLRDLVQK